MVLGYVVMRVPMVLQWLRAVRQEPARRRGLPLMVVSLVDRPGRLGAAARRRAGAHLGLRASMVVVVVLIAVEVAGPAVAERRDGGTPWHPHHIAERYGLLVIITLGEGLLGTMATLSAQVGPHGPGWSLDVAVLGLAGTALTFGLWWTYFVVRVGRRPARPAGALVRLGLRPPGDLRRARRDRRRPARRRLLPRAPLDAHRPRRRCSPWSCPSPSTSASLFGLYALLTRQLDPFHLLLVALSGVVLVASFLPRRGGVPLEWCLLVLSLTPWVTVVGYELVGHRHQADVVARMTES